MELQNMTIIEALFIKNFRGDKIEIDGNLETIKRIQKLPKVDTVIILTEEGSKVSIGLEEIYTWGIDVKKPRVSPNKRLKGKDVF